jgi:hypothetical protein
LLVGISTIGAFVVTIAVLILGDGNDGSGTSMTSTTLPTTTTTATATTTTTTTATSTTTEPPPPPIPTRVDQISIYIEALQGRKVGPTTYPFDGNLDFGLGYGWSGTAGGVEVDSEDCQIQRTAECSKEWAAPSTGV